MPIRYLCLTGGLGNQLFQYAALLTYSQKNRAILDVVNGNPRLNESGVAELLDFHLAPHIEIHAKRMPALTRKSIGYILRSHISPVGPELFPFFRLGARIATSVLVSIHYKKIVIVNALEDLGNDHQFSPSNFNSLLIGYFQSDIWARALIDTSITQKVTAKDISRIDEFEKLALIESPLIVHVRLGDYVAESGFGIPAEQYYYNAIDQQLKSGWYRKIWLFSDEPDRAKTLIPEPFRSDVRVMEQLGYSSVQTLQLMRLGKGYVIANSTFSFWGAYLSISNKPLVIYPRPWFKDIKSPRDLAPKDWTQMNAFF
jgi:hypothetical protein